MNRVDATTQCFEEAADVLGISMNMRRSLLAPKRLYRVSMAIEMDNGDLGTFVGYRVQHNNCRGPYHGGLRYFPDFDENDATALARLMSWKSAVIRIPFGGAFGGINCDPRQLSRHELETLTRSFACQIHDLIGPDKDIPTAEINTNPQVMTWIMNEYSKFHLFQPACVTGKPLEFQGLPGSSDARGFGVVIVTREVLKGLRRQIRGATIAISDVVALGSAAVAALHESGAVIVAVSDDSRAFFNRKGVDIPRLVEILRYEESRSGRVELKDLGNIDTSEQLLISDVDVLILAGKAGGVWEPELARAAQARLVVEAADGSISAEAEEAFLARGTVVVPDVLANSCDIIASYCEWIQNIQKSPWSLEQVQRTEENRLIESVASVLHLAEDRKIPVRTAALCIALERVGRAAVLGGIM